MSEQLLVIGLGIGEDADAAWFASGLSLVDPEPPVEFDPPFGSGLVNLQRGGSLVNLQRDGSAVSTQRGGRVVTDS
jgi:hypothetical protein